MHGGPSCDDATCQACVCGVDPTCCTAGGPGWDAFCLAVVADSATCADSCPCMTPTPTPGGDCCEAHDGTGCDTPACESCVCGIDSACCSILWDATCVLEASDECLDSCPCSGLATETPAPTPTPGGNCCDPHDGTGCDDNRCQGCVCGIDGDCCSLVWDDICVSEATQECAVDCSGEAAESCCDVHDSVGCDDLECQDCVCGIDETCCTDAWDETCVEESNAECAAPCTCDVAGDCCAMHDGVGCNDTICQDCVCGVDSTCCTGSWDQQCVDESLAECSASCLCDGADCCSPHDPLGCDDRPCQECVCGLDPLCCTDIWDETCAQEAAEDCANRCDCAPVSNCCDPGRTDAGCDDSICEDCVCGIDDACCSAVWDTTCTEEASLECAVRCTCVDVCSGDCGIDGTVTIDDLVLAVDVALGGDPASCEAADRNFDGEVSVDELIQAVNAALSNCSTAP